MQILAREVAQVGGEAAAKMEAALTASGAVGRSLVGSYWRYSAAER